MRNFLTLSFFFLIATLTTSATVFAQPLAVDANNELAQRHFEFTYGAELLDLPENANVKVWIPIAETNQQQTVNLTARQTPGELRLNRDAQYQNQIGSFEFSANQDSEAKFELTYDVIRKAANPYSDETDESAGQEVDEKLAAKTYSRYLKANRTVPVDGKPTELIEGMKLPSDSTQKARKLYDVVFQHMDYDKSNPGYGNGDSVWACDSKTGNCTDFHSLFISLARNQSLAARFEIGFPLPTDREEGKIGGYHCWAWFLGSENQWTPVDISEADKHPEMKERLFGSLPPDRIAFSKGRDIILVPASETGPLNFFVYPHVEVNGEVWPKEKIKLDFSFKNR